VTRTLIITVVVLVIIAVALDPHHGIGKLF
jgi:hypothetical protein